MSNTAESMGGLVVKVSRWPKSKETPWAVCYEDGHAEGQLGALALCFSKDDAEFLVAAINERLGGQAMTKRKYGTCEARMQDEFPGFKDEHGALIGGGITQVEDITNPSEAGEVVAWFMDPALAEKVVRLLNRAKP